MSGRDGMTGERRQALWAALGEQANGDLHLRLVVLIDNWLVYEWGSGYNEGRLDGDRSGYDRGYEIGYMNAECAEGATGR
jgi:hypothetical protein